MTQGATEDLSTHYPAVVAHIRLRIDPRLQRVHTVPANKFRTAAPIDSFEAKPRDPETGPPRKFWPLVDDLSDDETTHRFNIVPSRAQITLGGHRVAEKFDLSFDFQNLPIDPRTIKACGIILAVGYISPDDFSMGMQGMKRRDGVSLSTLDPLDATGVPRRDMACVFGYVDEWEVEFGDDGATVTMSGRGPIGIFMGSPFLSVNLDKLDLSKNIGEVVKQILSYHPHAAEFVDKVEVAPADLWPDNKIPTVIWDEITPTSRKAVATPAANDPNGKKKGRRKPKKASSLSHWDLITQYTFLVGAIPRWNGYTLEIVPANMPATLARRQGTDERFQSPFAEGTLREINGRRLTTRLLRVGRDTTRCRLSRKLGGVKAQIVEVVSYTPDASGVNKLLRAWWPEEAEIAELQSSVYPDGHSLASQVSPDGEKLASNVKRISVRGITDLKRLKQIAKAVFDETMRGEFTGSAETTFAFSAGGNHADPDLVRMRPGDGLTLASADQAFRSLIGHAEADTALGEVLELPYDKAIEMMTERLGGTRSARQLAELLVGTALNGTMDLQTTFYVNQVKMEFGEDTGLAYAFDFYNYLEVAMDAEANAGAPVRRGGKGGAKKDDDTLYPASPRSGDPLTSTSIDPARQSLIEAYQYGWQQASDPAPMTPSTGQGQREDIEFTAP